MCADSVRFWLLLVMGFLHVSMMPAPKEGFMQTFYMFYTAKENGRAEHGEETSRIAESLRYKRRG